MASKKEKNQPRKRLRRLGAVCLSLSLLLAACGNSGTEPSASPSAPGDRDPAGDDDEPSSVECRDANRPCDCGENLQGVLGCGSSGKNECLCDDPIPTTVQSSCMSPCGGDVTGSWRLVDVCHPEYATDNCDHYQRGGSADIGPSFLGFAADGRAAGSLNLGVSWDLQFGDQCMKAESVNCYDIEEAFDEEFRSASCDDRDGCSCEVAFHPIRSEYNGTTYTAEGDELSLGSGRFEYCVDGDELKFRVNESEITYVLERTDCPVEAPNCERWELPFNPSNLGDLGTVRAPAEPLDVWFNGVCKELTLDTDTLQASCGAGHVTSELRQPEVGPELAVFYFADLTIREGSELKIVGARPAVLVAKTMSFHESLSFTGDGGLAPFNARGRDALSSTESSGSGGGHCTAGGSGGEGFAGGAAFDDAASTVLWPGAPGGASNIGEAGGAGGRAIQLIARDFILVDDEAMLSVMGGQGVSELNEGSSGGGAGGTLLLEATSITVLGKLSARGGYGVGGFSFIEGSDGTGPGKAGGASDESGGGGAGKIILHASTFDLSMGTLEPDPTASPACAVVGPLPE